MATDTLATVLADLQFCTANGATVCMRANEQVLVLEKTNDKWWKVVRSGQEQPFYAPAANLQERTVPRVRLRSGPSSVRDRRRAPLSAVDAERHISGHEVPPGGDWSWQGAGSPVPRCSSLDDVLAESPCRTDGHSWHRRQSWAPERHGDGGAGPSPLPQPCHQRSRSDQQETVRRSGSEQFVEDGGSRRPAGTSNTWERKGPPPVPPGVSSTWERGGTGAPRAAHGASNTWERGGRAGPQLAPPEGCWERKGTSGPVGPSAGSWDHVNDSGLPAPHGTWERGSESVSNSSLPALHGTAWERGKNSFSDSVLPTPHSAWERGKDSVRVRGPMAMSWQTESKQAPVPPPRARAALPGLSTSGGLPAGRGSTVNQSAPSLAFEAIDARRPAVSALAARRPSPSSLSDLRALRPDLSDGHNEGYRRTAERLAGRSESPRPVPAVMTRTAAGPAERSEGLRGPEETGAGPGPGAGSGRPIVPPRPGRKQTQSQPQSQAQLQPAPLQAERPVRPPVPHILETPRRQLTGGWAEYGLTDGTPYFYNVETGTSSWRPPGQQTPDDGELSSCESLYSESESCSESPLCSPLLGRAGGAGADVPLPPGWRRRRDTMGQLCFVRDTSPTRWYSGLTAGDHVYYFAEGSSQSQWSLPPAAGSVAAVVPAAPVTDGQSSEPCRSPRAVAVLPLPAAPPQPAGRPARGPPPPLKPPRPTQGGGGPSDLGSGWPQLRAGEAPLLVIRQGTLSCRIQSGRRKGGGGGAKLWRHWAPCHLALTDSYLLLFAEVKDPASIRWGSPDHLPAVTVHLAGAALLSDSTASSKKNVLQLTTRSGIQVLLRDDNNTTVKVWTDALRSAISDLPSELKPLLPPLVPPKPQPQVVRSPSTRRANDSSSHSASESEGGTLEPPALTRENSRIRRRLRGFFSARPSPEELKRSGILKDERVFGRSLAALCEADRSPVPRFVQYCIEALESDPDSLRTEGLYRVSAGLDHIQRLRCQVDQENYTVLAEEPDPHVLAGSLKLFFRELPEPLLPAGGLTEAAVLAAETADDGRRTDALRRLVTALEPAHRSTLQLLLRHLTRVTAQEASNRMGARNLAVVFGPTLTRQPEGDPLQLHTADVMRQNVLVEALILDCGSVFPDG